LAAYAARDLAPDQPRSGGYAVTSIRYHPGKRHVLRYDPLDAAKGGAVFAKLYAGEDGARAFRVARQVADWLAEHGEGVTAVLPSVGVAIDALLDRARELHERLPQEPPTFTHGDFKSEHLWAGSGRVTLIDFDTCRLADPAFDVGRFLADMQLWHITHDQPGLEQVQERFLVGYAPGAPGGRLIRARRFQAAQRAQIARRVPRSNCDWASRTEQVIRRAQAVMNDLEKTRLAGEGKVSTQMLRTQRVFEEGSQI